METQYVKVPTGNGEPDLWRDADGYACWVDRSRVTVQDVEAAIGAGPGSVPDAFVLLDILQRNGLRYTEMRRFNGGTPFHVTAIDDNDGCGPRALSQAVRCF